ncbi:MAG: GNAT family N-acetyltransferase [Rufibacter sp.]
MIRFLQITDPATPEFSWAWQLYVEAFPAEERRDYAQQLTLLQEKKYAFSAVYHAGVLAGIVGSWNVGKFTYLEHFAVAPEGRGLGLGTEILRKFVESSALPIVLEVEPPLTEMSKRRIAFYEKAGFLTNTIAYQQPPYGQGKPWVPLLLMSFPELLADDTFENVKEALYAEVYNLKG